MLFCCQFTCGVGGAVVLLINFAVNYMTMASFLFKMVIDIYP